MRILFIARHPGYIRHYRSTLEMLARRGYEIILAFNKSGGDTYRLHEIFDIKGFDNIEVVDTMVPSRSGMWQYLAKNVRSVWDYLRYFDRRYANATKLRQRACNNIPKVVDYLIRGLNATVGVWHVRRLLVAMERVIPTDKEVDRFLKEYMPDLLLITPVVDMGSEQPDYIKSARALGIRTGLCVASWDNLTTKGLIKIEPQRVFVWNEAMKTEAVELHGMPPSSVVVTGAQCYDQWFGFRPGTTREEFCRRAGLNPERPYLVYLCSSRFIAPDEVPFVKKWIRRIREGGNPVIRDMGILIRPHFQNAEQWRNADFSRFENVTIYPPEGENVIDPETRATFYDTIYHSTAVVGLNTSAMIEAGILLKPVFTILSSENRETQEGTLHFHHLVKGGLLYMSSSFEEHISQLCRVLDGDDSYRNRIEEFIRHFVRPYGMDVPGTPRLAEEIERMGRLERPLPERTPLHLRTFRLALMPLALTSSAFYQMFFKKKKKKTKKTKKAQKLEEREKSRKTGKVKKGKKKKTGQHGNREPQQIRVAKG